MQIQQPMLIKPQITAEMMWLIGKEYEHEALPISHIISAVIWGLISIGCWLGIFAVIHKVWTWRLTW